MLGDGSKAMDSLHRLCSQEHAVKSFNLETMLSCKLCWLTTLDCSPETCVQSMMKYQQLLALSAFHMYAGFALTATNLPKLESLHTLTYLRELAVDYGTLTRMMYPTCLQQTFQG